MGQSQFEDGPVLNIPCPTQVSIPSLHIVPQVYRYSSWNLRSVIPGAASPEDDEKHPHEERDRNLGDGRSCKSAQQSI